MRILVTGGSGQLGTDVAQAAAAKGWQVWAPDHTELDITHPAQVESAIGDYRPDWVVHCAAYTAVDRAETEEKICMAVNAAGTAYVAHACTAAGCGLLYPSTDYVFDGSGTAPHPVTERPAPLNVYGRSKLLGEQAAQAVPLHAILRISWVFGLHGNNFVKTMLRQSAAPACRWWTTRSAAPPIRWIWPGSFAKWQSKTHRVCSTPPAAVNR